MALIRNGALVADDPWRFYAEGEALPADGAALVTARRWTAERERLIGRNAPIGVKLEAGDQPAAIAGDLDRFGLVAVDFPKFNDGRGYSAARLLRERHGYRGEIRAVGRVLRDQLLAMLRCGFDGFDLADKDPVGAWRQAVGGQSVFYQPAADDRAPARRLRHSRPWLARAS
jgi:uncharacterized protein (DUF934 family)